MASTKREVPHAGIVEGEMFGAPIPGWWPGGNSSEEAAELEMSKGDPKQEAPEQPKRRLLRRRKAERPPS